METEQAAKIENPLEYILVQTQWNPDVETIWDDLNQLRAKLNNIRDEVMYQLGIEPDNLNDWLHTHHPNGEETSNLMLRNPDQSLPENPHQKARMLAEQTLHTDREPTFMEVVYWTAQQDMLKAGWIKELK